jgi:hypothetical protein
MTHPTSEATPAPGHTSKQGMQRQLRPTLVGIAVVLALVVGGVVLVNAFGSDDAGNSRPTRVAAPNVVVGDADAVVLATSFDGDGARNQINPAVLDTVRAVDGVAGAQGAVRRFVQVFPTPGSNVPVSNEASERSTLAVSAEGASLDLVEGRLPENAGEVAVNTVLADRLDLTVGADAVVRTAPQTPVAICSAVRSKDAAGVPITSTACTPGPPANELPAQRVVGIFTPPGGDVDDVKLVALTTDMLQDMTDGTGFDRIDIKAADGVDIEAMLDRIGAALPDGLIVVPGSVVGTAEQLRAELEIQRAYHWLLSTDLEKRQASNQAPSQPDSGQRWADNEWQILNTEMRVSRVAFVDSDIAIVTYAAYYGPQRSSLAPDPFTGLVVRVDGVWKLSAQDVCQLSAIQGPGCDAPPEQDPANFVLPPDGWSSQSSASEAVAAFRVLADPSAALDARVAAVQDGDALRDQVAAGVADDASRAGAAFNVVGARLVDADHAQILYSLVADGEPRLETPYPLVASAVRVDGVWRAARRYACGLQALAGNVCPLPAPTAK